MPAKVDVASDQLQGIISALRSTGMSSGDARSKGKHIAQAISDGKDAGDVEALLQSLYELQQEAPKIMAALQTAGYVRKNSEAVEPSADDENDFDEYYEQGEEDEQYSDEDDGPAVGQGISDDISIMSDLTTPTVVSGDVNDEEHYHEVPLPPYVIGNESHESHAMVVKTPKQKSLIQPVKAGQKVPRNPSQAQNFAPAPQSTTTVPSGGGAAAKRRNQYTQRMARLGVATELQQKPLPSVTRTKKKDRVARFSFADIAAERSALNSDDLSTNAIETAIYGEAPKSPDLPSSGRRIGKLQTQSLMDDTDDLFESGFDAFVPFTDGATPFTDFRDSSASPEKTNSRKAKSKSSKSESSFRRKPPKKLALF
jgi:hypothetical protein